MYYEQKQNFTRKKKLTKKNHENFREKLVYSSRLAAKASGYLSPTAWFSITTFLISLNSVSFNSICRELKFSIKYSSDFVYHIRQSGQASECDATREEDSHLEWVECLVLEPSTRLKRVVLQLLLSLLLVSQTPKGHVVVVERDCDSVSVSMIEREKREKEENCNLTSTILGKQ